MFEYGVFLARASSHLKTHSRDRNQANRLIIVFFSRGPALKVKAEGLQIHGRDYPPRRFRFERSVFARCLANNKAAVILSFYADLKTGRPVVALAAFVGCT